MPDIISVIIALVLVIVAAVHDLREFRIPNRLIVAGIVVGVSVIVIRAFTGEYIGNYILGSNWNVDWIGICTTAYGCISYYRVFYGNC